MPSKNTETTNRPPIKVKVARLGGEVREYALNGERTVKAALVAADLYYEGDEVEKVRVSGEPADLDTELKEGDFVTVAGRIEGAL